MSNTERHAMNQEGFFDGMPTLLTHPATSLQQKNPRDGLADESMDAYYTGAHSRAKKLLVSCRPLATERYFG